MTDQPEITQLEPAANQPTPEDDPLRRLIRLVIGIVLIGQDALREQLPIWEAQAQKKLAEQESTSEKASPDETPVLAPWFPKSWEYRLIGMAFESPKYIQGGISILLKTNQKLWRKTAPLRMPLDWLGISDYTSKMRADLVDSLRVDLARLEDIGEAEALPSRMLGRVAIQSSYNALIEDLARDPKIKELVQWQSVGITQEIVEEVRERSVSFDLILDQFVRRLLRLRSSQTNKVMSEQSAPSKSDKSQ